MTETLKILTRPMTVPRWPEDVERLRTALNKLGFDASASHISEAYDEYSETFSCGWLSLVDGVDADYRAAQALLDGKYLIPT